VDMLTFYAFGNVLYFKGYLWTVIKEPLDTF